MTNKYITQYQKLITTHLKNDQLFLYWKGRVALYALLKSIGIQPDDEVLLPAYTCVVVPNAILYLNAKPIYVDIDPLTYNIDVSKVSNAITPRTKAIICQNTYGLSSDLSALMTLAKKNNLITIEDCAHGFGGTYQNHPNGTLTDAAFFSTQWNKPFSTGLGGFLVINNPNLIPQTQAQEPNKIPPSTKDRISLWILYQIKRFLLADWTYWPMVKLYRFLSKHHLILGSSGGTEITSITMPPDYVKGFTPLQAKQGIQSLANFPQTQIQRKKNAQKYTEFLQKTGKNHVPEHLFPDHIFLKYPLLVTDRAQFLLNAEKAHIRLGDWFLSPLHPVLSNWHQWQFDAQKYPIAVKISSKMVNLPTDIQNTDKVIRFLNQNMDLIENT